MKKILLATGLLMGIAGHPQCPFTATLSSTGKCAGAGIHVTTSEPIVQISWRLDNEVLATFSSHLVEVSPDYTTAAAGIYRAVVTNYAGCPVTTNSVAIQPTLAPDLTIAASANQVCDGTPLSFTASPIDGLLHPVYQWMVGQVKVGGNESVYSNNLLKNGDTISCRASNGTTCALAVSNKIVLTLYPNPHVDTEQIVTLQKGESVVLHPNAGGDISKYLWSPVTGLSDPGIENPVASPLRSTTYTLEVTSVNGCTASGKVVIDLLIPTSIPNAFTPNSDGRNDIFYIPQRMEGSMIRDFIVFNRWGEKMFEVHHVPPGDPASGWNGNYKGRPALPGTYVYTINLEFGNGVSRTQHGVVILVR